MALNDESVVFIRRDVCVSASCVYWPATRRQILRRQRRQNQRRRQRTMSSLMYAVVYGNSMRGVLQSTPLLCISVMKIRHFNQPLVLPKGRHAESLFFVGL